MTYHEVIPSALDTLKFRTLGFQTVRGLNRDRDLAAQARQWQINGRGAHRARRPPQQINLLI